MPHHLVISPIPCHSESQEILVEDVKWSHDFTMMSLNHLEFSLKLISSSSSQIPRQNPLLSLVPHHSERTRSSGPWIILSSTGNWFRPLSPYHPLPRGHVQWLKIPNYRSHQHSSLSGSLVVHLLSLIILSSIGNWFHPPPGLPLPPGHAPTAQNQTRWVRHRRYESSPPPMSQTCRKEITFHYQNGQWGLILEILLIFFLNVSR